MNLEFHQLDLRFEHLRMRHPERERRLPAELEHRFGYSLDEPARQFDRSPGWVSRRLAIVALLPDSVQPQIRSGKIAPRVAMKHLVIIARATLNTENIVFIAPTGVGKTVLGCSILLKAIKNGYRSQFIRAQDLFNEMYASLADRSTRRSKNRAHDSLYLWNIHFY